MLRRLNIADLTLITIGAVIGSGIFRTPGLVAQYLHSTPAIISCWLFGGLMSLIGAFVFAELAVRKPEDGGYYAYLRDALHPLVGFLLGWYSITLLFVGSTAASAVLFANYFLPIFGWHVEPRILAVAAIVVVTLINVLGVRQGSTWQNLLVALKVLGIACIVVGGIVAHPVAATATAVQDASPLATIVAFGLAMLPVLYSYNNFQSATFMSGETKNPGPTIARGLIYGVISVVAIYIAATFAYTHVLGVQALAQSQTPASDIMRIAFGPTGALITSAAIAASTLGYMSNSALLAPRVYFQLAHDGLFFKQFAWLHPRTHVPVIAIALHGALSAVIAASGTYGQIINWITLPAWIFIGLAAVSLFVYRARDKDAPAPSVQVPLHPWSTVLLLLAIVGVCVAVLVNQPLDSLYSAIVGLLGVVFYFTWTRRQAQGEKT